MSLPEFFISFDVAGGPWEPTTNMLSLTISAGRQASLDTYGAATAEVVFRRVSANTADLDLITPGTIVTINDVDLYGVGNLMKVTDVINDFGITSNADICTITLEGSLADANRAYLNNYNLSADNLSAQVAEISGECGVNMGTATLNDPDCDGTTVTSVADWLQKLTTTINGFIDDTYEIFIYDRFSSSGFDDIFTSDNLVFSDGTVALSSGQIKISYDQMMFKSLGENYYTRVIVDPDGHAAQVSTLATASAPYRVLQLDTFNANTGQAQDYADFLLNTYSDPAHKRISSVSVLGQSTNAELLFRNLGGYAIAKTVEIIFRGTTYNGVIEGWVVSMTPGESRYTFYFSGAGLNNYLILDNTDRGVLDANRLGY